MANSVSYSVRLVTSFENIAVHDDPIDGFASRSAVRQSWLMAGHHWPAAPFVSGRP